MRGARPKGLGNFAGEKIFGEGLVGLDNSAEERKRLIFRRAPRSLGPQNFSGILARTDGFGTELEF